MTREECYEIIEQFRKLCEAKNKGGNGIYYAYGSCASILSNVMTSKDKETECAIGMNFILDKIKELQNKE